MNQNINIKLSLSQMEYVEAHRETKSRAAFIKELIYKAIEQNENKDETKYYEAHS